jgi:hypothetical protein
VLTLISLSLSFSHRAGTFVVILDDFTSARSPDILRVSWFSSYPPGNVSVVGHDRLPLFPFQFTDHPFDAV